MKKILIIASCCLGLIILLPGFSFLYWAATAIIEPDASMRIHDEFEKLPSEALIKKLEFFDIDPASPYPQIAMEVLAKRQDKEVTPFLIKLLKSWHPDRRYQAIRALGIIGDERAIKPLLEIVEKGENKENRNYRPALFSLCQIGYEPARSVVLNMLKRPDGARNGSTAMMQYIGTSADIPALETMLSNIQGSDVNARLDRSGIKKAIEAIKQREGIK